MANQINFNVSPYYDDYDEDKKFLKILFRPGYSVQSRELTQLQTILQKQVDRFGQHMFREGSMIIPGDVSYDTSHNYAKIYQTNLNNEVISEDWFINSTVRCEETGVEAKVTDAIGIENSDPITLYLKYTSSGEDLSGNPLAIFRPEDILIIVDSPQSEYIGKTGNIYSLNDDLNPVGIGSAAYISEGVYFTQGYFVKVDKQKIFLEKYQSTNISYRVGLKAISEVVTERDDITLLSNASGSPNYAAPGAHRFKIDLQLFKIEIQPEEEPRQPSGEQDFIELLVIKNNIVYKQVRYTDYNILEKTLARRTYDESGDYTVVPFLIKLKNYLNDGTNNGIYERSMALDLDSFSSPYVIQEGDLLKQTSNISAIGTVTLFNSVTGRVFYILSDETNKFGDSPNLVPQEIKVFHYENSSWVEKCTATATAVYGNDFDQKLGIVVEPGKAYVKGHEIEKIAKEVVAIDRSLSYNYMNNIQVNVPHGNAIYVKNISGSLPKIHNFQLADIYDNVVNRIDIIAIPGVASLDTIFTRSAGTWDDTVIGKYAWSYDTDRTDGKWCLIVDVPASNQIELDANTILYSGATNVEIYDTPCNLSEPEKIGTCRIKFIQYDSGDITIKSNKTETNDFGKLFLHIFDTEMFPGKNFENAQSIYTQNGFKCDIITDLYKLNGIVSGSHVSTANPNTEYTLKGSQETKFLSDLKVGNVIYVRPAGPTNEPPTDQDRIKIIITSVENDYQATYKILSHVVPIEVPLINKDAYYVQFSSLDAPLTNNLVYRLPHANVKSLHKFLSSDPNEIDVKFATQRTLLNLTAQAESPTDYYVDIDLTATGEQLSDNGDNYLLFNKTTSEFIPVDYVESIVSPQPGEIEEAYIHVGNNPGVYDLLCVIYKKGVANSYRTKTKYSDKNFYVVNENLLNQDSILLQLTDVGHADYPGYLDVFNLKNVYMATSIGGTYDPVGEVDVTERYILDSGQKDNYYDYAKLIRKKNAPLPTGNLRIVFDYFKHGAPSNQNVYYCVNSYGINYDEIPTYTSSDGTQYELRDCIDFRPDVTELDQVNSRIELQLPSWYFTTDYEFYLNRKDKLILSEDGNFQIVRGVPEIDPVDPQTPPNSMLLYKFFVPAYTSDPTDIELEFVENKRYTMRDIGKLEKRLENLEYYTSLALLEKETADMKVRDPETGLDRFQLGFIVDSFQTILSSENSVGDINNSDCRCSIDTNETLCRPTFDQKLTSFVLSNLNDYLQQTGDILTLKYTEKEFIKQEFATYYEPVNPYNISIFRGMIQLDPPHDEWKEEKYIDAERVNVQGNYKSLEQLTHEQGTIWNDWETNWSGWQKDESKKTGRQQIGWVLKNNEEVNFSSLHFDNNGNPLPINKLPAEERKKIEKLREKVEKSHPKKKIIEQRWTETKSGSLTTIKQGVKLGVKEVINEYPIGEKVVSINYIPFIRSRIIRFSGKRFQPNAKLYAFFDNKAVSKYCCTTESQYGGNANALKADPITGINHVVTSTPLKTNSKGDIVGYFEVPNKSKIKFETGERQFKLTTSIDDKPSINERPSYGEATYKAQGFIETKRKTIMSVRNAELIRTPINEETSLTLTDTDSWTREIKSDWIDPIAQTFFVDSEGGAFITSVDIFFKKKPTINNIPIEIQIREVTGDQRPDPNRCVPFGRVLKYPENIIVSDLATSATKFIFESPIYLMDKTAYAICLISESDDYEVFVANKQIPLPNTPQNEIKNIIITPPEKAGQNYSLSQFKQYMGVFFRSQNGGTWNDDQYVDLKFTLYKAQFNTDNIGMAEFGDNITDSNEYWELLPPNAFKIKSHSYRMRVRHPNHGLRQGQKVSLRISDLTTHGIDSQLCFYNENTSTYQTIIGSQLLNLNIERAETDYYVVNSPSSDLSWCLLNHVEYSGYINDENAQATRNKKYDIQKLMVGELNFGSATSTRYQLFSTSFTDNNKDRKLIGDILPNENYDFKTQGAQIIYNKLNRKAIDYPSSLINVYFSSTNSNLSPVVDTKRFSSILVNNRIDNPDIFYNFIGTDGIDDIVLLDVVSSDGITLSFYADGYLVIDGLTEEKTQQLFGILSIGKYINIVPDIISQRLIKQKEILTSTSIKLIIDGDISPGSIDEFTLSLYDYYVDEIAPVNGSASAKYVTRVMALANSASMLKIYFAAYNNINSEFKTYYKILTQGDKRDLFKDIEYTLIEPDNIPVPAKSPNQKVEYRYTIDFNKMIPQKAPFIAAMCKIVMIGSDSADPPKILDFRMIALE